MGVFCYEKFNLGYRVSGTQCIEAQESLAVKRGGRGLFLAHTLTMLGHLLSMLILVYRPTMLYIRGVGSYSTLIVCRLDLERVYYG